jgi:pimeloyl-ACP methyl ester carboxylesterase
MIDVGRGAPLVLLPGIQGRWEWMTPAIRALAAQHRVLSFSLDEVTDRSAGSTFDAWNDEIDVLLDRVGEERAAIVGVSFGGLIASRYAASRPGRTAALVLVSTPAPRPAFDPRLLGYLERPRLALPFFAARACTRLLPEAFAARLTWASRLRFLAGHAVRVARFPMSPRRMSEWVRAWMAADIAAACRLVTAPTLLITGEPSLDRVVPVDDTLLYLGLIRGSRHELLRRTGHIGLVSRPNEFASLVTAFLDNHWQWAERDVPIEASTVGRAG